MKLNNFEYPILAGIFGLLVSVFLLTCSSKKSGIAFQEVQLDGKKEAVIEILATKIRYLDKMLEHLRADSSKRCSLKEDSCAGELEQVMNQLSETRNNREEIATALYQLSYSNADTVSLYYSKYLTIAAPRYRVALDSFNGKNITIHATIADTSFLDKTPFQNTVRLTLRPSNDKLIVDFVERNPVLGFWLILSIAQMALWFLLAVLLPGRLYQIREELRKPFDWKETLFSLVTPLIGISLFLYLFYFWLVDAFVFKDAIILDGFNARMIAYSIPGYIVAIICFAVFIFSAGMLKDIDKKVVKKKLAKKQAVAGAADDEPQAADQAITDSPADVEEIKKLKSLFNGAFIASAVVLSLFVLWLGILFNGVNQMEASRFYEQLSGRQYLNGNFVYMVGLMHTVLLLLFYIPVKLKFDSLDVMKQEESIEEKSPKSFIKFLGESLGTLLLTASPLIASLIEKAIANFL